MQPAASLNTKAPLKTAKSRRKFHLSNRHPYLIHRIIQYHLSNRSDRENAQTSLILISYSNWYLLILSKAFDSICHSVLLNRIQALGTSTNALHWFQSYLTEREQTNRVGISTSSPLIVTHGVPQGSILGPVLFSLYMDDLPDAIKTCSVESYVDDTKLFLSFATNDNVNALSQIGQDLNRIAEWCCTTRLLINLQKRISCFLKQDS